MRNIAYDTIHISYIYTLLMCMIALQQEIFLGLFGIKRLYYATSADFAISQNSLIMRNTAKNHLSIIAISGFFTTIFSQDIAIKTYSKFYRLFSEDQKRSSLAYTYLSDTKKPPMDCVYSP